MIYFVTVNYHSTELISQLINSLPKSEDFKYNFIIINNSPDDQTIKKLASKNILIVDAVCNLGFGSACNLGLKLIYTQDKSALVWIINPDTYFIELNLKIDSFFTVYSEVSILGTIIRTPRNEIWFAGGKFSKSTGSIFNVDLATDSNTDYVECDWVSGCSMIVNFRNFSECPLFDSKYFLYYEDFDFCQRYIHEGYKVAITKSLSVVHEPSSITNRHIRKKILYSTYSYLITLERYTNKYVFSLRLIRLIISAIIFAIIKPDIALGKIQATFMYWRTRSQENNILNLIK